MNDDFMVVKGSVPQQDVYFRFETPGHDRKFKLLGHIPLRFNNLSASPRKKASFIG